MSFRLVSSGGSVADAAFVNASASGTVRPGYPVDFVRSGTGGALVAPSATNTTQTSLFGVSQAYAQGASDTFVPVILFTSNQLWEVDCANAAITAQVGLRHAYSLVDSGVIHNTSGDVTNATGVFHAVAMVGATTGSGKLLGRFQPYTGQLNPVNVTTFSQ